MNALTQNNSFSYSSASYIKDNAQINELEKSNTELRGLLDEHQAVLEIVMSKYREQVLRLIGVQKDSAVIKNDVFLPTTKDEVRYKIDYKHKSLYLSCNDCQFCRSFIKRYM